MNDRSPLTYRSMHLLVLVLFCLAGAHLARAHILLLMHSVAGSLSFLP